MTSRAADPKRYRDRAEECRTAAECMSDPTARATLLRCADDYECWAARIEQRDARPVRVVPRKTA